MLSSVNMLLEQETRACLCSRECYISELHGAPAATMKISGGVAAAVG